MKVVKKSAESVANRKAERELIFGKDVKDKTP